MATLGSDAAGNWRDAFVARQRIVVEHYRQVLRRPMTSAERQAMLRRVSGIEGEILVQQATGTDRTTNEHTRQMLKQESGGGKHAWLRV